MVGSTPLSDLRDDAWLGCKMILGAIIIGILALGGLIGWILS